MRRNVGIFTYDFYPFIGGQGRYIYEIYKATRDNPDFNIYIFSPCRNNKPGHVSIFTETKNSRLQNIEFSFKLNLSIKRLIKEHKIDIAHFGGGPGGVFLVKKLDIPVVYTAYHTYYQQYKSVPNQQWKWVFSKFEPIGYHFADKIISISTGTQQALIDHYGIDREKITVIPPGVDIKKFHPANDTKKIPNSLLFVGRLDRRKGIDFLIETMPLVIKKKPEIRLFVAGKGRLLSKLRELARENNLAENIRFLKFVPDEDLPEWYNRVEGVVVPSIFEGFGVTIIEAMACGVPVIATNVDGIRDIIENNENGILVEYDNKEELAGQIINLLNSPQLRERFFRAGLQTIKEKFDRDRIVPGILEIYKKSNILKRESGLVMKK